MQVSEQRWAFPSIRYPLAFMGVMIAGVGLIVVRAIASRDGQVHSTALLLGGVAISFFSLALVLLASPLSIGKLGGLSLFGLTGLSHWRPGPESLQLRLWSSWALSLLLGSPAGWTRCLSAPSLHEPGGRCRSSDAVCASRCGAVGCTRCHGRWCYRLRWTSWFPMPFGFFLDRATHSSY